jgi:imidazolonepropionase-like amidohydrolase
MIALTASLLVIAGGTVIDARGEQHPGLNVVCDGDKIRAVTTTIPAGAKVIDAKGAWVSVGLFDAASRVGLTELGQDDVSKDGSGGDGPVCAGARLADGFDPNATAVPVTRVDGVTMAALTPTGGLFSGQGAVVELGAAPRVLVPSTGQFSEVSPEDTRLGGTAHRARTYQVLRELFQLGRQPAPPADKLPFSMGPLDLQGLRSLVGGKVGWRVSAHRASDILNALKLAQEQHVPLTLYGAEEGWLVAKQIAAARVPVVLFPFADLPASMETRGARLDNAALLAKAGVRVAIGSFTSTDGRDLRQAAGVAVANGLPWATAWRAVTAEPAAIYGLGARYGDVAPGMAANLVIWGGDPFEQTTAVKGLVVGGQPVSLESRQDLLARKYRHLP